MRCTSGVARRFQTSSRSDDARHEGNALSKTAAPRAQIACTVGQPSGKTSPHEQYRILKRELQLVQLHHPSSRMFGDVPGLHLDALLAAGIGSELLSQGKVLNYKSAAGFQQGSK